MFEQIKNQSPQIRKKITYLITFHFLSRIESSCDIRFVRAAFFDAATSIFIFVCSGIKAVLCLGHFEHTMVFMNGFLKFVVYFCTCYIFIWSEIKAEMRTNLSSYTAWTVNVVPLFIVHVDNAGFSEFFPSCLPERNWISESILDNAALLRNTPTWTMPLFLYLGAILNECCNIAEALSNIA